MEIRKINFSDILPIWENNLWPGRKSPIKPVSTIQFMGSYDMSLKKSKPTFFGAFVNDKIAGVISGFKTSEEMYRCRGIYVFEKFRGRGYSQKLFLSCEAQALEERSVSMWSLPKKEIISVYQKFGFIKVSEWIHEYEFGPNCFVKKVIKK